MFDILPIIANMPKGRKLYSKIHGDVTFARLSDSLNYPIAVEFTNEDGDKDTTIYATDGRYMSIDRAECVLFPSYMCRDWNHWAEVLVEDGDLVLHKSGRVVRFDSRSHDCDDIVRFASAEEAKEQGVKDALERIVSKTNEPFNSFDRVLVCNNKKERLIPRLFSQKIGELFYCQDGKSYKFCIPYDGNESAQYIV